MRKKTLERIASRLTAAEYEISSMKNKIMQLECSHEKRWFGKPFGFYSEYSEVCGDCGKVLNEYNSKKEMLAAKVEYIKESNKKRLDDVKKEEAL